MIIKKETIEALKVFNSITERLSLNGDSNMVAAVSDEQQLFLQMKLKQEFPQDFILYNLRQFVSVLSKFDSPTLSFSKEKVVVSNGTGKMRNTIIAGFETTNSRVQPKEIKTDEILHFNLTLEEIKNLINLSSIQNFDTLRINLNEDKLQLMVYQEADITSANTELEIDAFTSNESSVDVELQIKDIKNLYPANYDVFVRKNGTVMFRAENTNIADEIIFVMIKKKRD